MTDTTMEGTCRRKCWIAAAVVGLFVALFALGADRGFVAALVLGVLAMVLLSQLFIWVSCAPVPKLTPVTPKPVPAPKPVASPAEASAAPAPTATPAPAAAPQLASAAEKTAEPLVKPSKALAGEAELAGRKGAWRYEGETAEAVAEDAGTRPEALSAPRDGGADNLKEIKGVGPKLEEQLNELGIYHFDQIAGWTAAEVAWMDGNLNGFRGRVSRDDWIGQAKILAAGGETAFSTRVDEGEVY
ncbi:Predicted 5' DNA nuclease, flap endonuclease-1-like, helix-3-turn-helix (H3TH) domain [Salipiger thiooxidans]|uniref:Predicted 5' DNA nuclease, flap endonuclease-1-like, helix-3-turn-helix (H3TH) domain n=1 Tax=Salipiger thiooxidans TaxID=282683 RepID=A0A1G7DHN5_9RHOB|nr:endonuclease [Salipiger thiooxidans]SDE50993.1 Predicted 5' DNA nuclease, flap endonuclease-1-like, helix-3-turn-helix (H3TH) domain [Salipiger thiooxidans]